jgi:hypothetical protein
LDWIAKLCEGMELDKNMGLDIYFDMR